MSDKPLQIMTWTELARELINAWVEPVMMTQDEFMDARRLRGEVWKEFQRRESIDNERNTELEQIKTTMSLCGIGEFKTWKECQDQAYDAVRSLSAQLAEMEAYAGFLHSVALSGEKPLTFQEWNAKNPVDQHGTRTMGGAS